MPPIKHWPDHVHFKGITETGQKFVYCPIGNIISWHPGDYDNGWCHWCKTYYELENRMSSRSSLFKKRQS